MNKSIYNIHEHLIESMECIDLMHVFICHVLCFVLTACTRLATSSERCTIT